MHCSFWLQSLLAIGGPDFYHWGSFDLGACQFTCVVHGTGNIIRMDPLFNFFSKAKYFFKVKKRYIYMFYFTNAIEKIFFKSCNLEVSNLLMCGESSTVTKTNRKRGIKKSKIMFEVSYVRCQVSGVMWHVLCVTCHLSPVTCHLSPVICHLSPVTYHPSLTQTFTATNPPC